MIFRVTCFDRGMVGTFHTGKFPKVVVVYFRKIPEHFGYCITSSVDWTFRLGRWPIYNIEMVFS